MLMPRDVTRDWFESPVGRQRAVGFAGASWAAPPPSAGHTAQATHAAQTAAAGAAASRLEAPLAPAPHGRHADFLSGLMGWRAARLGGGHLCACPTRSTTRAHGRGVVC